MQTALNLAVFLLQIGGVYMVSTLSLCFMSFIFEGTIGMFFILFIQGAFYNEHEKKNKSSRN